YSQEKWSVDRRMTAKPYIGRYTSLPDNNYNWENPNHISRVFTAGSEMVVVGPNVRVLPNSHQQDEIVLVRHPTNQLIMFGGANTTTPTWGQGGYITTDGGLTWTGNDLLSPLSPNSSDPGPTIDKNGTIIFTTLDPNMCAAYSTNNGVTWSPKIAISNVRSDK